MNPAPSSPGPRTQWKAIRTGGAVELINFAHVERIYVNPEGITCLELPDGVIETKTSLEKIALHLGISLDP